MLAIRFSDIYSTWKCPSCDIFKETIEHLILYPGLESQWQTVCKCASDYVRYFTNKYDLSDKCSILLTALEHLTLSNRSSQLMEWLTGLITDSTLSPLQRIIKTKSLTNSFILELINIYRITFKQFVWHHRNQMMKAFEASKNLKIKSVIKARKPLAKKQEFSGLQHKKKTCQKSQTIKLFETAITDLSNDHSDHEYCRILDDLSPIQHTNALTSFLKQLKKPNRLEMRKEYTKGLWISDTLQIVNHNHSTNPWRYNGNSSLNNLGKKSGSVWAWWYNWQKSWEDDMDVTSPMKGGSKGKKDNFIIGV